MRPPKLKKCSRCKRDKAVAEFGRASRRRDGLQTFCRSCQKEHYEEHPDRRRNAQRAWRYGMTAEQLDAMYEAQGFLCAICREAHDRLCVDHDHACCSGPKSCGKCVRGLLCTGCNSGIAMMRDSRWRLLSAFRYLRRYRLQA